MKHRARKIGDWIWLEKIKARGADLQGWTPSVNVRSLRGEDVLPSEWHAHEWNSEEAAEMGSRGGRSPRYEARRERDYEDDDRRQGNGGRGFAGMGPDRQREIASMGGAHLMRGNIAITMKMVTRAARVVLVSVMSMTIGTKVTHGARKTTMKTERGFEERGSRLCRNGSRAAARNSIERRSSFARRAQSR